MRKSLVVAITAISLVVTAPLAIAGGKATPKPVKATNKVIANKSMCSATSAVGHAPKDVALPTLIKNTAKNKVFTLTTNCGTIIFEGFTSKAPFTVSAMSSLASQGFFDGSLCHRLTTAGIFVLQCGDPTATGTSGAKFTYRDENLPASAQNNYPAGTIAMANSGPNTNSSQFFLVYANTTLGPNYTIWGQITQGLDIVKAIAAKGVAGGGQDGSPAQTIALEKVTVK